MAPSIEIEKRLLQLISLVDMMELQLQHMALGDEALGTARRQLRELDATSAMDVLKLLDQTAKRWSIAAGPQQPFALKMRNGCCGTLWSCSS